jgi:hypothetical protein
MLLISRGGSLEHVGYGLLFVVGGFFLLRLLIDPHLIRRPLLEPNLSAGGLAFMGTALLVFLVTNVVTGEVKPIESTAAPSATQAVVNGNTPSAETAVAEARWSKHGIAHPLLRWLPDVSNRAMISEEDKPDDLSPASTVASDVQSETAAAHPAYEAMSKTLVIVAQLAIVAGLVFTGYLHFDSVRMGVAAAALYLLLPYTARMTGRIDHMLPAAMLVWAIALYRMPLLAGMLLGLASGTIFYPIFLLPLWISFYWQRGLLRFVIGVTSMLILAVGSLALVSSDWASFSGRMVEMVTWAIRPLDDVSGFWSHNGSAFRITVIAAFVALSLGFALWPVQKNLGTLLSCSAAVMLGTQFWHAHQGGLYMAWYLPLLLLTIFRPNLEDRVALTALGEGWLARRKTHRLRVVKAA